MGSTDDLAVSARTQDLARLRRLVATGRAAEVVGVLDPVVSGTQAPPHEALVLLAEALASAGATDRALEIARRALECAGTSAQSACAGAALVLALARRTDAATLDEARRMAGALASQVRDGRGDDAARVHHARGVLFLREDRLDDARLSLLDALTAATACGNDPLRAQLHDLLADLHERLGDVRRALGHHDRNLQVRASLGDAAGRARTHRDRARILLRAGRAEAALGELDACVPLAHASRDTGALGATLAARGAVLTELRRFDEAEAALRAALRMAESAGGGAPAAACVRDLAVLADRRGRTDEAVETAGDAAARFESAGDPAGAALTLLAIGRIRVRTGAAAAARVQFERAAVLLRKTPRADLLAEALLRLAEAGLDQPEASALLDEAEDLARDRCLRGIVREVEAARRKLPPGTPGVRVAGAQNFVEFGRDRREYHLVERLGKGGQGETWKAVESATGRLLVVKFQPVADRTAEDRLAFEDALRDHEAALGLDHRGVVRMHDFEKVGRELLTATDLLSGTDLRAHLQAGPVDRAAAWSWIADLADAIDALHAAGIVHRDLRPENVLFDAGGRPVVIDYGLALLADRRGLVTKRVAGAPGYAAPEQWVRAVADRGPDAPPEPPSDRRADLFAFGSMAIELLAGTNFLTGGGPPRPTAEHIALMKDPRRVAALADAVAWPAHVGLAARVSLRRLVDPDPAARPQSASAAIAACTR